MGAILLFILLIFLILAVLGGEPGPGTTAGSERGVTIDEIANAPEQFIGQTVTVSGEVENIVAPRAFLISEEGVFDGAQLLVVGANANVIGPDLAEDEVVQVIGVARRFEIAAFEQELGADLEDEAFREFEGDPAILARSVIAQPAGQQPGTPAPGQPTPAGGR